MVARWNHHISLCSPVAWALSEGKWKRVGTKLAEVLEVYGEDLHVYIPFNLKFSSCSCLKSLSEWLMTRQDSDSHNLWRVIFCFEARIIRDFCMQQLETQAWIISWSFMRKVQDWQDWPGSCCRQRICIKNMYVNTCFLFLKNRKRLFWKFTFFWHHGVST